MRKPFQDATVRWALERLADRRGSRRVLISDEVGLGKTFVAQGVVDALAKARSSANPLRVFYLCSSLSIARQNRDRLLEILPEQERKQALVDPGRLTLLLDAPEPKTRANFRLYTLTPGTSLHLGTGLALERLALARCVWRAFDYSAHDWFHEAFRVGVGDAEWRRRWNDTLVPSWFSPSFCARFVERVKVAFPREDSWRDALAVRVRATLEDAEKRWMAVARLRSALILTIVEEVAPDVVIFDEFQRFFEVLPTVPAGDDREEQGDADADDHDAQAREIVGALIGAGRHSAQSRAAVLMLSATPYRMYAAARERDEHHEEFYRLASFLFGSDAEAGALRDEFRAYRETLSLGPSNDRGARSAKRAIEERLCRVMARTERGTVLKGSLPRPEIEAVPAPLSDTDMRAFHYLSASASDRMRYAVEPFWSSVPFALQMMPATDYAFRRDAQPARLPRSERALRVRFDTIRAYHEQPLAHPRLRALLDALPADLLTLPWLPPSKAWWALGGPFAVARERGATSKALIFSRYRAVPRSIATLLSYEAERRAIDASAEAGRRRYDYTSRSGHGGRTASATEKSELKPLPRPAFTMSAGREWLREVAMFLPWPELASLGDPLPLAIENGALSFDAARAVVAKRIRERFPGAQNAGRPIRAWRWILELERRGRSFTQLESALRTWRELPEDAEPFPTAALAAEAPSDAELSELADIALCGPGPVLLRAVRRIFGEPIDPVARLSTLAEISVSALASYLDAPEFHLLFATKRARRDRRAALRRAVWQGNLEAVLDEHLASEQGLGTVDPDAARETSTLEALREALTLRDASLLVDRLNGRIDHAMRLRCHAAVAFGVRARIEKDIEAPRNDQVRVAFNSPFRPMVLVTTSIGQEGLDFHRWASHLVHWDLPDNPVDLEQRDGRLNRYGNLAVRKVLASRVELNDCDPTRSPWHVISSHARKIEDPEGLVPWWFVPNADLRRTLIVPSFSELTRARDRLQLDLDYYRLALGQPDQEALIRQLQSAITREADDTTDWRAWLRDVAINLKPAAAVRVERRSTAPLAELGRGVEDA